MSEKERKNISRVKTASVQNNGDLLASSEGEIVAEFDLLGSFLELAACMNWATALAGLRAIITTLLSLF